MKKIIMFLFLFSKMLLGMQEERATVKTVIQKLSKAKKRKLRRHFAKQAQSQKDTVCSLSIYLASVIEKAFVYKLENSEIYEVKVVFDLDFPPASFEEHTRQAKTVKIIEHHRWHPCSWEIPEYAFACWTKRRDEALEKNIIEKFN